MEHRSTERDKYECEQSNLPQQFTAAKAMALEDSSDHHSHLQPHGQRVELILSVTDAMLPYTLWPCGFLFGFVPFPSFSSISMYSRHSPSKPTVMEAGTCPRFASVLILVLILQATSFTSGHPKERTPGPASQGKAVRFDTFESCNFELRLRGL